MAHSADLPGVTLPGSQQFTLHSPETGGDYLIQVGVPEAAPPAEGYPVLYVLDGNARFALVQSARETLSRHGPFDAGSPLLIVAIGYPDTPRFDLRRRTEDYTPPAPGLAASGGPGDGPQGGAARFLAFIERRLKPLIDERFTVDHEREALFGHSYGGLFALHVLLTRPESFDRYIAISPSLWWNEDYLLTQLPERPIDGAPGVTAPRVLIGVGGREQTPRPGEQGTVRGERRRANAMVDNARTMAERLQSLAPRWQTRFVLFEGEDHGSVMWPATRRALAFALDEPARAKWD
ncbi:alpha/beta hydrolase [Modicisalibacter radicis]|uniref:alpha/beta hydrolase n=1 Tax=Halomonas sp. EAR18 TaxID=2518972 RepID=UPI001444308B|nr:alpha/beta hydrolase-fold protein [Halomonas sp. EAR18]